MVVEFVALFDVYGAEAVTGGVAMGPAVGAVALVGEVIF